MIINTILTRVIGTKNERELKRLLPVVQQVGDLEPSLKSLSDGQLAARTVEFRGRLAKGESLDELLPEVFYSVGTDTSDLKTGSPTITIANGLATLSVAQLEDVGVGDVVDFGPGTLVYARSSPFAPQLDRALERQPCSLLVLC